MKSVLCCFRAYLHQWCQQNQQSRTLTGILQQPGLERTGREPPRCSVLGSILGYTLNQDPAARNRSVLLGGKSLDTFGPHGAALGAPLGHKGPVPGARNLWIRTIVDWEQHSTSSTSSQAEGGAPPRRASSQRPGQGSRRKRNERQTATETETVLGTKNK